MSLKTPNAQRAASQPLRALRSFVAGRGRHTRTMRTSERTCSRSNASTGIHLKCGKMCVAIACSYLRTECKFFDPA